MDTRGCLHNWIVQINETILFAYRQITFHLMCSKISMNIITLDVQIWITEVWTSDFLMDGSRDRLHVISCMLLYCFSLCSGTIFSMYAMSVTSQWLFALTKTLLRCYFVHYTLWWGFQTGLFPGRKIPVPPYMKPWLVWPHLVLCPDPILSWGNKVNEHFLCCAK